MDDESCNIDESQDEVLDIPEIKTESTDEILLREASADELQSCAESTGEINSCAESTGEIHSCAECDFQTTSWDEFMNHSTLFHFVNNDHTTPASKKNRFCPHCAKGFTRKATLNRHIAVKHEKSGGFSCNDCNYVALTKANLMKHIKRKHLEKHLPLSFPCFECDEKFDSAGYLNKHLFQVHGNTKFKCPQCDFVAACTRNLKFHIDKKHERVLTHDCTYCSFTTKRPLNLRRHVENYHQNKPKWNRNNEYKCDFCDDYVTNDRGRLVDHIQDIHKQEKIYYCDSCSYSSYWEKCLKTHSYTHKEDKKEMFGCQYCSFQSRSEDFLKKHIYKLHMMSLISENSLV